MCGLYKNVNECQLVGVSKKIANKVYVCKGKDNLDLSIGFCFYKTKYNFIG